MMTEQAPHGVDSTIPNVARIYDYLLGGKDNISQVVSRWPYNGRTVTIQARHNSYSNIESLTVRELYRACMGFMSDFSDGGS
jgi:S-adenosyl methyltransferase